MTRKCEGLRGVPCNHNAKTSSKYCAFHLWWLRHYIWVNRAISEIDKWEKGPIKVEILAGRKLGT